MNEALEKFFEKYGDFGKTDKYYGNMHQVLAGQVYTGGVDNNQGKKTAWGFDKQKPSFAGRKDVEKAVQEMLGHWQALLAGILFCLPTCVILAVCAWRQRK